MVILAPPLGLNPLPMGYEFTVLAEGFMDFKIRHLVFFPLVLSRDDYFKT